MAGSRIHDVCVIGSGAAGAVAADALAAGGLDVVVVEQGRHVPAGTHLHRLIPTFETARARDLDGNWVESGYPWTACAVGGGTRFYAGISLRLREVDFDASAHAVPEALPVTWPIGYDDLRPHYDAVERRLGVARAPGLDPLEPPSGPPALPAHAPSRRGRLLSAAARSLGLRPFPLPLAVNSRPFAGAPVCDARTGCTDYACPIGAKADVSTRLLEPLVAAGDLTLLTGTKAVRLVEGARGRVDALDCRDGHGRGRRVRARAWVLACNAVQTAALLLRSRSRYAPAGLGNDRDLVGRGLCFKVAQYVRGVAHDAGGTDEDARREAELRGLHATVGISDHYLSPACPTGMGGLVNEANPVEPFDASPGVLLRVECLLADQPLATNRVALDWGRPDRDGLPRVVLDYRPHRVDLRRLAFLRARAVELLRAAGSEHIEAEALDFTLGSGHLHGTCRFGDAPGTSVCDATGRLHGAGNVFVADGGLMPFPGAVNPTLTIQALARRTAGFVRASV